MQGTMPVTGTRIEARCTKCRKNIEHLVLAATPENRPERVQCTACRREHTYRPPTAPRQPAPRSATAPGDAERREWARLRPAMNAATARSYSMTEAYRTRTLINHPQFGLGLVRRQCGPHKMEILFADGCKTMRCK